MQPARFLALAGCPGSKIGKSSEPAMTCDVCHREYCFVHANAHVGRSCEWYAKHTMTETRLSEAGAATSRRWQLTAP